MDPQPGQAELTIEGLETADHTVPADVLLRTLNHLQRIVHLVAAAGEGRPIRERFALPEEFRKRHELRCGVPGASSFAVPLFMAASPGLPGLGRDDESPPLQRTLEIMDAASREEWAELGAAAPDPRCFSRILTELQAMLPRPGDRWSVALRVGSRRAAVDSRTYRSVRAYASPEAVEDAMMTVTGDLVRVDIESRRIVIRYRPTGGEIRCDCEESALEGVLEHWSEPIQVTGRFSLDRRGNPTRLTGVTRVEPMDLSPMTFDRIDWSGRRLLVDPPLVMTPSLDEESGQFYQLADEELGVDVFARTREAAVDELAEQMLFQWDAYAHEVPERLTIGARRLRDALLARVREVDLATPTQVR